MYFSLFKSKYFAVTRCSRIVLLVKVKPHFLFDIGQSLWLSYLLSQISECNELFIRSHLFHSDFNSFFCLLLDLFRIYIYES